MIMVILGFWLVVVVVIQMNVVVIVGVWVVMAVWKSVVGSWLSVFEGD